MRRPALLAAAALLAAGSLALAARTPRGEAGGASRASVTHLTRFVQGQEARILIPADFAGRVVLVFHGAGGTAYEAETSLLAADTAALTRAGYLVATSTAHGNNWGSAASVADDLGLLAYVSAHWHVQQVFLLAQSMGGLDSLQAVPQLGRVSAFAGLYVVCNLATMVDNPDYSAEIDLAWGSRAAALQAPLSPVPTGPAFRGLPMLFWASPQDTVVPKATNTNLCAGNLERDGALTEVVTTRGQHGDPSNVDPPRLVAFFDAAARLHD